MKASEADQKTSMGVRKDLMTNVFFKLSTAHSFLKISSSSYDQAMSPDSIFLQNDEGEATAVPIDQDELQLVICIVGMAGS